MNGDFTVGDFHVQPKLNKVTSSLRSANVEPKAMEVLVRLAAHPGEVASKDDLLRAVWSRTFVGDEVLKNAVWELRKALGDDAKHPTYIQTIPKRGYRLVARVHAGPPVTPATPRTAGWRPQHALIPGLALASVVAIYLASMTGSTTSAEPLRLAVLPFSALHSPFAPDPLVDGLTVELATLLGRLDPTALAVISPGSAMQYRQPRATLADAVADLSLDFVVEGTMLRADDQLRLNVQLSRGDTQAQVWSGSYTRTFADIIALQTDLARTIASEIQGELRDALESSPDAARSVSEDATRAYLWGNHYQFVGRDWNAAMRAYQDAVTFDPTYAVAHARLAYATIWASDLSPRQALRLARQAARRATQLDPNLADAHVAEGLVRLHEDFDWAGADEAFQTAIRRDPGSAMPHLNYAKSLAAAGRINDAIGEAEIAWQLDPRSGLSTRMLAYMHYLARDYEYAIEVLNRSLDFDPGSPSAQLALAECFEATGQLDTAFAHRLRYLQFTGAPANVVDEARQRNTASGHAGVLRLFAELEEAQYIAHGYLVTADIVALYAQLGELDQAFEWFSRAVDDHTRDLIYAKVLPGFDPLRSDPRFGQVLARLGLE